MRGKILALIAAALIAAPASAETSPAFEEAREFVLAGKAGNALLVIGIGAMGINEQDDAGYTLLHHAAKAGVLDSLRILLRNGAIPDIMAKDGATPLMLAADDAIRGEIAAAIEQRKSSGD